jgi:hypothetical protein
MKQFAIPRAEASLANHEAYVAAQVRDLFRTIDADDATGVNECLDRIGGYLENWLFLRLLDADQRWHTGVWWIDGISTRPAGVLLPNKLRVHGSAYMQLTQQYEENPPSPQVGKFDCALYEPFEFELELSPTTGAIAQYRFRFGDDRPAEEKRLGEPVPDELPGHRRWIFTFYRHCTEAGWKGQRSARGKYTNVGSPYEDFDNDDGSRAATIAGFARDTAISTRLLMRAEKASDSEAYEICMFHLRHVLLASLRFHIRVDPDWDRRTSGASIELIGEALPDVRIPNRLILRDEAVVSRPARESCREPVTFEIELHPQTGDMSRYTYCFGKKKQTSAATSSDPWQFVFHWPS